MFVQVKDSAVPKRETTMQVARIDDSIIMCLNDKHVEAIGLTLFLTEDEAHELAVDLLKFTNNVEDN